VPAAQTRHLLKREGATAAEFSIGQVRFGCATGLIPETARTKGQVFWRSRAVQATAT